MPWFKVERPFLVVSGQNGEHDTVYELPAIVTQECGVCHEKIDYGEMCSSCRVREERRELRRHIINREDA